MYLEQSKIFCLDMLPILTVLKCIKITLFSKRKHVCSSHMVHLRLSVVHS